MWVLTPEEVKERQEILANYMRSPNASEQLFYTNSPNAAPYQYVRSNGPGYVTTERDSGPDRIGIITQVDTTGVIVRVAMCGDGKAWGPSTPRAYHIMDASDREIAATLFMNSTKAVAIRAKIDVVNGPIQAWDWVRPHIARTGYYVSTTRRDATGIVYRLNGDEVIVAMCGDGAAYLPPPKAQGLTDIHQVTSTGLVPAPPGPPVVLREKQAAPTFGLWKCKSPGCPDRKPAESPSAPRCYTCGLVMDKILIGA